MPVKITDILKKWPFKVLFGFLALVLIFTVFFFSRKPVILVCDKSFNAIYGEKRADFSRFTLSLSLLRPVKTIAMTPDAGPDLVVQGAMSLSRRPFAVFFPYRYREAAARYLNGKPDSTVVVLAGRKPFDAQIDDLNDPQSDGQGKLIWFYTDTETDLYRAGAFAGIFGQYFLQNLQNSEEGVIKFRQKIALFNNDLNNVEKSAFTEGLEAQQWSAQPFFLSNSTEEDLICAVLLKEFRFPEEGTVDSLILFSWIDPELAPRRTLVIFDDSPWAQIGPALDVIRNGGTEFLLPSRIIVSGADKTLKSVYNDINKLKTLKKTGKNADN